MDQSDIIAELLKEAESKDEGEISRSEIDELKNFIFFLPATTFESIHPPNLLCRFSKYVDISVKHIDDKYSDVTRLKKLQTQLVGCKNTIIKFASKSESYPNSKNHKLKAFHDLLPNKFTNKNTVLLRLLSVLAIREFCCSPNYHSNHGFKLDYKNPIVGNLGERLKNISSYLSTTVVTDEYIRAMFDDNVIELTKSRSRHSNDNALAESKNASIVRKQFGYQHIAQKWAPLMNEFNVKYLYPYINYHRPFFFPEVTTDKKGKQRKRYLYKNMMTPYEKLKSLADAKSYLKPDFHFEILDEQVMEMTDNDCAELLQKERNKLFNQIFEQNKRA